MARRPSTTSTYSRTGTAETSVPLWLLRERVGWYDVETGLSPQVADRLGGGPDPGVVGVYVVGHAPRVVGGPDERGVGLPLTSRHLSAAPFVELSQRSPKQEVRAVRDGHVRSAGLR